MTQVPSYAFEVKIDGTALTQEQALSVLSLEVERRLGKIGRAVLRVEAWDAPNDRVDDATTSRFAVGKAIVVSLGYATDLTQVFEGVVVAQHLQFSGPAVLELECCDAGIALVRSRTISLTTSSDNSPKAVDLRTAIEALLPRGLSLEAPDLQRKLPHVLHAGATDWDFVCRHAAHHGLYPYVDKKKLRLIAPTTSGAVKKKLAWGSNVLELRGSMDLEAAPSKVAVTSTRADQLAPERSERPLAGSGHPKASQADKGQKAAQFAQVWEVPSAVSGQDASSRQAQADGLFKRQLDQAVRVTGRVGGDPELAPATVIELDRVGDWTGKHFVRGVRHVMTRNDFETTFECGCAPVGPPEDEGQITGAAATQWPAGIVRAKVTGFEDPTKSGHVQVSLPWLGKEETFWARLSCPDAGSARGWVSVPEPGDEVLVAFVQRDQGSPVILGSLFNGQNKAPDFYDTKQNNSRGFVSRSGHRLVLHDEEGKQTITLKTQAGQEFLMDDTDGKQAIRVTDKTGNTLVLDDKGITLSAAAGKDITLQAPSGKVVMNGNEISAEAKTTWSAKAVSATLEGSAKLSCTGAQVEVSGKAQVKVAAALVMLN